MKLNCLMPWVILMFLIVCCRALFTTAQMHSTDSILTKYYNCVIDCIKRVTAARTHSVRNVNGKHKHQFVSGWNYYVRDKHDIVRKAYMEWIEVHFILFVYSIRRRYATGKR